MTTAIRAHALEAQHNGFIERIAAFEQHSVKKSRFSLMWYM